MDPIVLVLKVAFGLYVLTMVGASLFVWIAYRRDPYPPEAAEPPPDLEQVVDEQVEALRPTFPEEAAYWTDDADGDPGGPFRSREN